MRKAAVISLTDQQSQETEHHLRLCPAILSRNGYRTDADTLQVARRALCVSMCSYDPAKGKLGNYAGRIILGYVITYLRKERKWKKIWLVEDLKIPVEHEWPDLDQEDLLDQCFRLIETLDRRKQKIIRMRYLEGKTLREVGKNLHVTPERVRQIEIKALDQIRSILKKDRREPS